jgi:hypothetical protein
MPRVQQLWRKKHDLIFVALFGAWRDAFFVVHHRYFFEPKKFDCVVDGY